MLNAGSVGHIGERSLAAIAEQPMARAPVHGGIDHRAAVDQEDVDQAVAVVVEEQTARSHRLDQMFLGAGAVGVSEHHAGRSGNINELW